MKNILLLCAITLVTFTYAKDPIERESLHEAEGYKVEAAVKERPAGRAFAGAKAKKEVKEVSKEEIPTSEDSEVRYWRYSE